MKEVKFDNTDFKALSVDTRVKILKLLSNKKYTQSDLAEMLTITVPSVKEHLDFLLKAGFIEKIEEGRKWKYYSVTDKTKSLFNSELYKFVITLGIFVILAGISFISSFQQGFVAEKSLGIASELTMNLEESSSIINLKPVIALASLVFLGLAVYFLIRYKKVPSKILRSLPK